MVIGVLQAELLIGDAASLKDKRRVLRSIKDRLHQRLNVAVAEVARTEAHRVAVLGIVSVSASARHAEQILTKALEMVRAETKLELTDQQTEILTGQ